MQFRVVLHRHVEQSLDQWLTFDGASQVLSNLLRELRTGAPRARKEDRDKDDPQLFRYQHFLLDGGYTHLLDFAVNDGWEADALHVIGVEHTLGRPLP
jgi:hypothetical protein